MVLITIVTGANLNQLITGGPHIVWNWHGNLVQMLRLGKYLDNLSTVLRRNSKRLSSLASLGDFKTNDEGNHGVF